MLQMRRVYSYDYSLLKSSVFSLFLNMSSVPSVLAVQQKDTVPESRPEVFEQPNNFKAASFAVSIVWTRSGELHVKT